MATWYVKTKEKKSVEEHNIWTKNNLTIRHITGYRWGEFNVQTSDETPPTFVQKAVPEGNDSVDSVNMWNCGYESDLVELDDGWFEDFIWPDNMAQFARDSLEVKWNDNPFDAWEEEGWELADTEVWFTGPLEIGRVDI